MTGCPAVTDGLDGDLARLQEWPRREDGPVRVRAAGCGAQPVRRVPWDCAPAAAAVATALRRAAAGWCGEFPAGASRPLSAGAPALPRRAAYAVTRRQARGALSAPLNDREENPHRDEAPLADDQSPVTAHAGPADYKRHAPPLLSRYLHRAPRQISTGSTDSPRIRSLSFRDSFHARLAARSGARGFTARIRGPVRGTLRAGTACRS